MTGRAPAPAWLEGGAGIGRWCSWILALLLHRSGILALVARRRARRGDPLVLLFHRVVEPGETLRSQPGMVVTAATFDEMLACVGAAPWLAPVRAADAASGARTEDRLPVAITFDDGWRDTGEVAAPILARHRMAATLFVSAGFAGTERLFWPERILAAGEAPGGPDRLREELSRAGIVSRNAPPSLDEAIERLKSVPEPDREAILLAAGAPERRAPAALLSWEGVRALASAGWEIGSHGNEHRILTRIPLEEAALDLTRARERIAAELGRPPEALAYPNGEATTQIAETARRAGHERAYVVRPVAGGGRHLIPRRNVHEGSGRGPDGRFSPSLFLCDALGVLDPLRRALPPRAAAGPIAMLLALLLLLAPVAADLARAWGEGAENAHGFIVPVVVAALVWSRREKLALAPGGTSWRGALLLAGGLAASALASAASSRTGSFVALLVCVWGVVWASIGDRRMRILAGPLAYLLLAVPIPFGLEVAVSGPVRSAATRIGVLVARLAGTPVVLAGNVIHMKETSLHVDDACGGMRSLVSLFAVGLLYLAIAGPNRRRGWLLVPLIPVLAIAGNAARLFGTILAVQAKGPSAAAGAAHEALGGAAYVAALAGLFLADRALRCPSGPRRGSSSPSSS